MMLTSVIRSYVKWYNPFEQLLSLPESIILYPFLVDQRILIFR